MLAGRTYAVSKQTTNFMFTQRKERDDFFPDPKHKKSF